LWLPFNVKKPKVLQLQGAGLCPLTHDQGFCTWTPLGALAETPIISSRCHACHEAVPPDTAD